MRGEKVLKKASEGKGGPFKQGTIKVVFQRGCPQEWEES